MFGFGVGTDRWPGIAKLAEECGEVVQVIGKLMMTGGGSKHWDGLSPLHERLSDEMGDALAAILFVCEQCVLIRAPRVFERAKHKLGVFRQWHADGQGYVAPSISPDALAAILR
jgi:hypothetical protein